MPLALLALLAQAPALQPADGVTVYPPEFFAAEQPNTALDMVTRIPGFSFDGGANIRGFAGAEGNVRIDGELPVSRGDSMAAILRRMPAASVARIELITSATAGVDMQGRAIIANVVRKPGVGSSVATTTGVAVFEDGRTAPNLRIEGQAFNGVRRIDGSIYYGDDLDGGIGPRVRYYIDPAVATLPPPVISQWDANARFHSYGATGAWERPWNAGRIRLNGAVGASPTEASLKGFSRFGTPTEEVITRERFSGEAGARYTRTLENGVAIQATAYQQLGVNDFASGYEEGAYTSLFTTDRFGGESILRLTARRPATGRWSLDGGAESAFNWVETDTEYQIGGTPIVLPAGDLRVEELRGEVFATAQYAATPKINLQAGLRVETSTISSQGAVLLEKSLTYVKPRAVLTWSPAQGQLVVLRAEREVAQLPFDSFAATASLSNGTVVAGNPDLEPERSTVLEARYERRFAIRGAFVAQLVHREIDNPISRILVTSPGGTFEAPANIAAAERDALIFNATLPLDGVGVPGGLLRSSLSLVESRLIDPITGDGRRLSGEAPWDFNVRFSQDVPGGKWRWGWDYYQTDLTYTWLVSEVDTAEGEPLVALWAEIRPRPDVTLRMEGVNLLDRVYTTTRAVYSAPRDTGDIIFRERRDLARSLGGRGVRVTLRRSY